MMILRFLAAMAVSTCAWAQTTAQIAQSCDGQMLAGLCAVRADAADYASTARMFLGPPFGAVPISAYLYLRSTGDDRCQAGAGCRAQFEMCHRAASSCETDWSGHACKVARSFWGQ